MVCGGVTVLAHRHLVVHTDYVDHQRVSIPVSYGISHPRRIEILWVRTPVGGDDAEEFARLVENHHEVRRLHDLYGIWLVDRIRHSARQAMLPQRKGVIGTDFILLRAGLE